MGLTFLLAPLALYATAIAPGLQQVPAAAHSAEGPGPMSLASGFDAAPRPFEVPSAGQVRVRGRVMLRISPMRPAPRDMAADMRTPQSGRFTFRPLDQCLPVESIRASRINATNQVLLYLKDRRIVSATLSRACRAQSFYSGFYLEKGDGQLCAGRDSLLSRSGASCGLDALNWVMVRGAQ